MKLYYSPGASSLSAHIVLEESGLPADLVLASTKTHRLEDGTDYYTINPLGYVPLLELDDGTRLREGSAIVQYLADQVPTSKDRLKSRYSWVDEQLADRQFLMGESFTVADAYLFTATNWSRRVGPDLTSLPNVQAWRARVGSRPAVQAAMKAEGLSKA